MKRIWLLFTLLLIITILLAFISSFYSISGYGRSYSSSISAVVISKERYLSVRADFYISPYPNSTMTLSFPNATQITVASVYHFDVLLPKTDYPNYRFAYRPEETFTSDAHPMDAKVISNITSEIISDLNETYFAVSNYWFTVQGDGTVTFGAYGVPV